MAKTDRQDIPSPIGENSPRIDAREKVTGAAIYADDIQFGNSLLHARIKRSPHPHALIKKIDTTKASALPGDLILVSPWHYGVALQRYYTNHFDTVPPMAEPTTLVTTPTTASKNNPALIAARNT